MLTVFSYSAFPATNSSSSSPSNDSIVGAFPAGSYTLTTYLTNTSTACVSNSATWVCPPGQTYSQSPTFSEALFAWVINGSSPTSNDFNIASAGDIFSIEFPSTNLTLENAGQDNERYAFTVNNVQKITYPTSNMKCFFNTTTLTAHLYTKKSPTLSVNSSSSASASASGSAATGSAAMPMSSGAAGGGGSAAEQYAPWPHAVDAMQSINGGSNVPQCFEWTNGVLGNMITQDMSMQPVGNMCSCLWTNYND